jgi:hypothetical protein
VQINVVSETRMPSGGSWCSRRRSVFGWGFPGMAAIVGSAHPMSCASSNGGARIIGTTRQRLHLATPHNQGEPEAARGQS